MGFQAYKDTMTKTEQFVTIVLGILAIAGMLLRAKGKWDETNSALRAIKTALDTYWIQHERDHGRIDRTLDKLETQIDEHVGRHRRY